MLARFPAAAAAAAAAPDDERDSPSYLTPSPLFIDFCGAP